MHYKINILFLLTYLLVLLNYWMMLDDVVRRTKRLTCTFLRSILEHWSTTVTVTFLIS